MDRPLVSVVIPCYRGERYLPGAIESCLRQTYRAVEIIVVDDASPDGCSAIAERFAAADPRVRVVRHPRNLGVSEAFNTGFRLATGRYFARLAQDDLFREDALAFMLDHIRRDPAVGLVYCDMQLIDADGQFMHPLPTEEPERALLPCHRAGVCVLWTLTAWETVGPFDPRYELCDDYEFFLRISRRYPLTRVEGQAPFFFRYHPDQGSVTREREHDVVRCRVHLAHARALLRQKWYSLVLWKRMIGGWVRLLASRTGLYQYWK